MAISFNKSRSATWSKDILFLTISLGILFFAFLGSRPLFVPDEGRYAEIAREMVASGDYVTPYLNQIEYFEKPVFFYWLESAAINIGGLNLWSIRSVNALLAIFGCLVAYATARKLYDRNTGLLSALILGTSLLYFLMDHMVSLDLPVTVFLSTSLFAFLLSVHTPPGTTRRLYCWTVAIAAALAVLTKGLIGLVFPLAIFGMWIALTNQWRLITKLYLPSSILIFLCITAPWHLLVGSRHPEFFYFYFIEQHFLRYTTLDVGHYQPAWFFIPWLLVGFLPWTVFLIQAYLTNFPRSLKACRDAKADCFLWIWVIFVFAFFSFSKSKLIPYILPLFPALAMLVARYLVSKQTSKRPIMIAIGLTWATLIIISAISPRFDVRTIQPLALQLKPILLPGDDVITYNQYYQDLPFYLERKVSILNWHNELSFGMNYQDTRTWMIDNPTFANRWNSKQRVFLFISKDEFEHFKNIYGHYYPLGNIHNTLLISNHRP